MKSISIFLFGTFMLLSCKNETPAPKISPSSRVETNYCELFFNYEFPNDETIYVNYGSDTTIWVEAKGRMAALNLMAKNGWEFVTAYVTPLPSGQFYPRSECHFILKRSKVIELRK